MPDVLTDLTLNLSDTSSENLALLRGWNEATRLAFHQPSSDESGFARWLAIQTGDAQVLRGLWDPSSAGLRAAVPVATFAYTQGSLNAGRQALPASMILGVSVAPTHRRRGLMASLMTDHLRQAAGDSVPVAALTASEGAIYQRFGFGVAIHQAKVRVDTSNRFQLRNSSATSGQIVMLDAETAWPMIAAVSDHADARERGSLTRPRYYETWLRERYDFDKNATSDSLRYAVHLGNDSEPDGFVVYEVSSGPGGSELKVRHLRAAEPAAYLALWRFLADIDLVETVTWPVAPVGDPLPLALRDARVYAVVGVSDHIWLRILDPVRALQARPWFAEDALVVEVNDPLEYGAGRFAIEAAAGQARVEPASAAADVTLDIETLAALYLGGAQVSALRRAGRIQGEPAAIERFGALCDGGDSPQCAHDF